MTTLYQAFLITIIVPSLMGLPTSASTFPVFPVNICPKNESEVEEASKNLNCSIGYYETENEYHCVPLSNFTQLVEFCYPKTSGLIGKGLCMVLSGNTLDARECHQFEDGCPNILYTSETMYQFPVCSLINKESKCYLADPMCPSRWQPSSTTSHITTNRNVPMDTHTETVIIGVIVIVIFILLSLIQIAFVCVKFRRRRIRNENDGIEERESLIRDKERESEDIPKDDSTSVIMEDEKIEIEDCVKDDEFRKRFKQYLEEGYVDVCPISQIIIVGENGVGKTTLLYRLQGRSQEEIDQIRSTIGVDCHTKKSGFIVTDGQLKMNIEEKSNLAVPPESVLAGGRSRGITKEIKTIKEDKKERGIAAWSPLEEQDTTRQIDVEEIRDDEDTSSFTSDMRQQMIVEDEKKNSNENEIANNLQARNREKDYPSTSEESTPFNDDEQPTTDENTIMSARAKNTEIVCVSEVSGKNLTRELLSIVKQKLTEEGDIRMQLRNKNDVVLNVLDFAGQGAYYASHQSYMRENAIYIIVYDVSRNLTEGKGDEVPMVSADERTYLCDRPNTSFSCWAQKDYIHYWLNTIRVHGGKCENIILVGTHGDSKRSDYELKYRELLPTINHLLPEKRCEVIIDLSRNCEKNETKLTDIKAYICKAVSNSERVPFPAKWLKYEHAFAITKSKYPFISIDCLLEIIDQTESEMWDVEIHDMLRYFHKNGSILYFNMEKNRDIIILDIQWFVDCFKYIITDQEHANENNATVNKDVEEKWNLFCERGVLDSSLYEDLLKRKAANVPQEILGKYLQKLGMMLYIKGFEISEDKKANVWYVPCVNTEEFKPILETYDAPNASPILCFRFVGHLPMDLFGRMIVLCISTGKWLPFGRRLYKEGADMLYRETDDNKNEPSEVYLFTAKQIITVQIVRPSQMQLHGQGVRAGIQNIIQELLANFYACSMKCNVGFLCSKKEGYKESSVKHFIPITNKEKCCHGCQNLEDARHESEQAYNFWKFLPKEDYILNEIKSVERESQYIAACYWSYLKVREQILIYFSAEKEQGFGSFYTSLLKNGDSISTTTTRDSHLVNDDDQETKMEKLESFVDIGLKLKHLSKTPSTNEREKERSKADIKEIAHTLKKIWLAFGDKNSRRNFFFSWTNIVEDIQLEDIHNRDYGKLVTKEIPEISFNVPNIKVGDDVKLEARVDVGASHFIWLKKKHPNNKFEILRERTFRFGERRKNSYAIKQFSKHDEGQYQLIVATKQSVGRRIFQLQTDEPYKDTNEGRTGIELTGEKLGDYSVWKTEISALLCKSSFGSEIVADNENNSSDNTTIDCFEDLCDEDQDLCGEDQDQDLCNKHDEDKNPCGEDQELSGEVHNHELCDEEQNQEGKTGENLNMEPDQQKNPGPLKNHTDNVDKEEVSTTTRMVPDQLNSTDCLEDPCDEDQDLCDEDQDLRGEDQHLCDEGQDQDQNLCDEDQDQELCDEDQKLGAEEQNQEGKVGENLDMEPDQQKHQVKPSKEASVARKKSCKRKLFEDNESSTVNQVKQNKVEKMPADAKQQSSDNFVKKSMAHKLSTLLSVDDPIISQYVKYRKLLKQHPGDTILKNSYEVALTNLQLAVSRKHMELKKRGHSTSLKYAEELMQYWGMYYF